MLKIWDADNFRRTLAGLCCFAAPAAMLTAMLTHPGVADGLVASVAAEPGRIQATALLMMLTAILFVPAMIGIAHLVRGRGVVLIHLGVALTIAGAIGHAVFAGFQIVLSGVVEAGVDPAELEAMVEGTPNTGFVIVLLTFLAGFFPGLLLVAAGLWRSRAVPVWVPAGLVALALADFVPFGAGRLVAAIVPAFGVVCFGAIGLVLLRLSDQAWRGGTVIPEVPSHPVPAP